MHKTLKLVATTMMVVVMLVNAAMAVKHWLAGDLQYALLWFVLAMLWLVVLKLDEMRDQIKKNHRALALIYDKVWNLR